MFAEAYERPVTGAEATYRRYRLNGEIMWMRMRAFFLRREQDRTIFFASLADVTEQKQQEDELRESQAVLELEDEVLHRIIQQSDLNVWVYDIASDRLSVPEPLVERHRLLWPPRRTRRTPPAWATT